MKANNITNSIYSILNEDKFSKYTYFQIFDELGADEFLEYLAELCKKAIKNNKISIFEKMELIPKLTFNSEFSGRLIMQCVDKYKTEELRIVYSNIGAKYCQMTGGVYAKEKGGSSSYFSEIHQIPVDKPNIYKYIEKIILILKQDQQLNIGRDIANQLFQQSRQKKVKK